MDGTAHVANVWRWVLVVLFLVAIVCGAFYALSRMKQQGATEDQGFAATLPGSTSRKNETKPVPMASYEEVRQEYERRRSLWRIESDQVSRRQEELAALDYRLMNAEKLLRHSSPAERSNLAAILGLTSAAEPPELIGALRKAGSHTVTTMVRRRPVEYEEVVKDVAVKLGAKKPLPTGPAVELEGVAIKAAMDKMLEKASPQQRDALAAEMAKAQSTSSAGLIAATGGLVLANLSGFGLYVAASTSLAALTGAVGVTLPFAAYTGMSSILAAATGPVGWAALAAVAVYKFGGTKHKKTVPGVIAVASSRARLMAEREAEGAQLGRRRTALDLSDARLASLSKFIDEMKRAGAGQAPRASVPW